MEHADKEGGERKRKNVRARRWKLRSTMNHRQVEMQNPQKSGRVKSQKKTPPLACDTTFSET
jgi:hypothetical protein